jgi:hypothetical protein
MFGTEKPPGMKKVMLSLGWVNEIVLHIIHCRVQKPPEKGGRVEVVIVTR